MNSGLHYCYILRCSDNSLYTGYTLDPVRRLAEHNTGKGAKYTASRRPCEIVYLEAFESKHDAMSREYYIKHSMSKKDKEALIEKSQVCNSVLREI